MNEAWSFPHLFHFYKISNEQSILKYLDLNTFLKKLYCRREKVKALRYYWLVH